MFVLAYYEGLAHLIMGGLEVTMVYPLRAGDTGRLEVSLNCI